MDRRGRRDMGSVDRRCQTCSMLRRRPRHASVRRAEATRMRILITGGKGQLGRELVRALEGHELLAADRAGMEIEDPALMAGLVDHRRGLRLYSAGLADVDRCGAEAQR